MKVTSGIDDAVRIVHRLGDLQRRRTPARSGSAPGRSAPGSSLVSTNVPAGSENRRAPGIGVVLQQVLPGAVLEPGAGPADRRGDRHLAAVGDGAVRRTGSGCRAARAREHCPCRVKSSAPVPRLRYPSVAPVTSLRTRTVPESRASVLATETVFGPGVGHRGAGDHRVQPTVGRVGDGAPRSPSVAVHSAVERDGRVDDDPARVGERCRRRPRR